MEDDWSSALETILIAVDNGTVSVEEMTFDLTLYPSKASEKWWAERVDQMRRDIGEM